MVDVIVIGGGPAGLSAAVYTARADQETLVLDKGGGTTRGVDYMENFYGFPDGISGEEIVARGEAHATKFGAEIRREEVVRVADDDGHFVVETTDDEYEARGLVLATGASYETPAIADVDEYEGRGVSYCVECDAYFYRDRPVAVVGAGNYAAKEALMLLDYTDDVRVLTNGDAFDADPELADRLREHAVEVITDPVDRVAGEEELERVVLRSGESIGVDGLFVALGAAGGTDIAETLGIPQDGPYLRVDEDQSTTVDRVYAAGDLTGGNRQVATSIGEGADAAINLLESFRGTDYVDYRKLDA
ncbi:NAD(P)/FAD-dependent oxidoreductase [Haloplanus salinus]|uniref:NAD(P)/FAD-dependent oxidoreductase n=1 Tax=Haloplanus salinus TaxID=1126245 RepID=A0A368NCD3_9EURY|nr:NAD(P)/FAD-dependent oxidoreductase [Haloplanus salinus]RCU47141.1 NAD(P)/FAD-dependent oxidoreductase [Haloplanus salinus]